MGSPTGSPILPPTMLQRFRDRAPGYDRENRFFQEDFDELRGAGYLALAVPRELGGSGLTFAECMREQRRLASYAHATALAINMHLYWVGVAADLWRAGDNSLEWMLRGAVTGEVFAAGHAERGNDMPLLLSTTKAERVDGGYRFTGHKSFGSLTPVWTYFGLHGMDTSDPAAPKIVHAFLPRGAEGYSIKETWDVLGMRATASQDTVLHGAFVPDQYIARVVPAGFAGADLFILAIFAWALIGFANVYYGLARHALDLTVDNLKNKTSIAISRGSLIHHPEVQHAVADMVIELEAIEPASRSARRRLDPGCRTTAARGRRRSSPPSTGRWRPPGRSSTPPSIWPAASASSRPPASSGCSATPGSAESTRPTPS